VTDRMWAGWRSAYVSEGPALPEGEGSLFERILSSGLPDEQTFVLWRGERSFALLNLYPYTTGHLLVVPNRAVEQLDELDDDEAAELWSTVRAAVAAVRRAYRPDGMNVGFNLGSAGGAGVPDHLHGHVMPRWRGDTNFTTTIADLRILPEPLGLTWRKLRDAWPDRGATG
jgi:diadenosine tetraphosphate (Ap4A) HIT family hydrolase